MSTEAQREIGRRRTFAIISHPDAGKTTISEKLLLMGGVIGLAGAVKARKAQRSTRSDWLSVEKERGISVSTSVLSFEYGGTAFNLLDTPGHNDFSEDTYRTLTAVDAVLMIIDAGRGVQAQTRKLLEVCRRRRTPVITFMNKLDQNARDPLELIDEVEAELGMVCAPMTWPLGSGHGFGGVYDLRDHALVFYKAAERGRANEREVIGSLDDPRLAALIASDVERLREEVELVEDACIPYDAELFAGGEQTPVFFGSALNNFGVKELLDCFCDLAPPPQPRRTRTRVVEPAEEDFTGFVFKIQANMDPRHRDRMAFIRVCSGRFRRGMSLHHVRTGKPMVVRNAMTFFARDRSLVETAWPGDIIGVPSHGKIRIADTFTAGEDLEFTALPKFAPEIFKRARLVDPMGAKALGKGLQQLCEEGAAQLFRPATGAAYIVGALGVLQFDVIAARLRDEYNVEATFEATPLQVCRWLVCDDGDLRGALDHPFQHQLYRDERGFPCLLAESRYRAEYLEDKNPRLRFVDTMELA